MKAQTGPEDAWKSSSHKISQGLKTWTSSKQVAKALNRHPCALHVRPGDKEVRKRIPEEFFSEHQEGSGGSNQGTSSLPGAFTKLVSRIPSWWWTRLVTILQPSLFTWEFFCDLPVPVPTCTLGTSGSSQSGVISCPRGHLATPGDIFWSGGCRWHQWVETR